jgi:2,3-dihydro-2,3-dihydroxybenzoate dehydrogenase
MSALRLAVVTGGGGAFGRAIALALAADRFHVAVWDQDGSAAEATAQAVHAVGGHASVQAFNLTDDAALQSAVQTTRTEFGGIDALVNNAGIYELTPIKNLDLAVWDRIIAVNLRAAIVCIRECIPSMIERGGGAIVNLSSLSGILARMDGLAYSASKAAILRVTADLALELACHKIRVNAISPGSTNTRMLDAYPYADRATTMKAIMRGNLEKYRIGIPLGRLAEPEDHAGVVAFLLSEGSRHITGQNIVIDGGQSLA